MGHSAGGQLQAIRPAAHNVVKQVTILAQLADEHARHFGRVFWDADAALESGQRVLLHQMTYEADNVWMAEIGKELELANVH